MDDKQISDKRLDEIEARHKAATPGPWTDQETGYSKSGYADGEHYHQIRFSFDPNIDSYPRGLKDLMSAEDAAFIAHARDDVPDLAAEVRRLKAENEEMRKKYAPWLGIPE